MTGLKRRSWKVNQSHDKRKPNNLVIIQLLILHLLRHSTKNISCAESRNRVRRHLMQHVRLLRGLICFRSSAHRVPLLTRVARIYYQLQLGDQSTRVMFVVLGVGIRAYFGGHSRGSATSSLCPEFVEHLTQKITQEVTENIMKQFEPALESLNQSQHTPIHNDTPPLCVSTRGSCIAATNTSWEEKNVDKIDRIELCIYEHPPHLVALGRVIEGGQTLHGVPLSGDLARVIVEDV